MRCLVPFETVKFTWIGFSVFLLFYANFEYKYLHALFRFESDFFSFNTSQNKRILFHVMKSFSKVVNLGGI